MKRAGFTMIELIFVIVILGILAAVALPKFIGVSEQAEAGKCKAFVGTLNRTVGPVIWADGMANDAANIATAVTAAKITASIAVPTLCGTDAQYANAVASDANNTANLITIGDGIFQIGGSAPTSSESPIWTWTKTN